MSSAIDLIMCLADQAGLPLSEEELYAAVAAYPAFRADIDALYNVPMEPDELPCVTYVAGPYDT
jgi:hypothetical protein